MRAGRVRKQFKTSPTTPWRVRGAESSNYFSSRDAAESFRKTVKASRRDSNHKAILERRLDGVWRGMS